MKYACLIFFIFLLDGLGFLIFTQSTYAASYSINPAAKTINVNEVATLQIAIDTDSSDVIGGKVALSLSDSSVGIVSLTSTGWFDALQPVNSPANNVNFLLLFDSPNCNHSDPTCVLKSKTGKADIATVVVKGKQAGTASLSFTCSGNLTDSGIFANNPFGNNIINCSQTKGTTITVTSGGAPTNTPVPGGATPTGGSISITGEPTCDLCGACRDKSGNVSKPPGHDDCRKCLYNPDSSVKEGYSWIAGRCIQVEGNIASPFVQGILQIVMGIVGGVSFIIFLYGAFLVLTSRGDYMQLQSGKRLIVGAIGALLIVTFSIFILNLIGVEILALPGFIKR